MTDSAWQQLESQPIPTPANPSGPAPLNLALLESDGIIQFSGKDTGAFLQNQLTNDVVAVTQQQAQLSGYCSPKGRLLGLFQLIAEGEGYLAITSKDLLPGLVKRLQMYVMRSAVTLENFSDGWASAGVWGADADDFMRANDYPPASDENQVVRSRSQPSILAISTGFSSPAYRLVGPREKLARMLLTAPQALTTEEAWKLLFINAGQPSLNVSTADAFIPQMVNLDLVDGVNFQKGCYPGQEIVARTRYLGKIKKRMYLFETASSGIKSGDSIHVPSTDQSVGTVVSVAAAGKNSYRLLAVVRTAMLQEPLTVSGGITLTLVDAPYPVPGDDQVDS